MTSSLSNILFHIFDLYFSDHSEKVQDCRNDLHEVTVNVEKSATKSSEISSKLVHINKEQEKVVGLLNIIEGFEKLQVIEGGVCIHNQ